MSQMHRIRDKISSIGIAYSTKDRPEYTRQSLPQVMQQAGMDFDLWWIDGSESSGLTVVEDVASIADPKQVLTTLTTGFRGGPDHVIVYALTRLLDEGYDYIGLIENDILLADNWLTRCMALFRRGVDDGLNVGAVSARAFQDRVLIQRPDYAVMHNLGAGMVIFTREAAQIILRTFRTGFCEDNRDAFARATGIDIGSYWCFRTAKASTTADWSWDAMLIRYGLVSLAPTPQLARQLDSDDILTDFNLRYLDHPLADFSHPLALERLHDWSRSWAVSALPAYEAHPRFGGGEWTVFSHQMACMDHCLFDGPWRSRWSQGLGPFTYVGQPGCTLSFDVYGPCAILCAGSTDDELRSMKVNGYSAILPNVKGMLSGINLMMPEFGYASIDVEITDPDTYIYGLSLRRPPAPFVTSFTYDVLPPVISKD